MTYQRPLIIIIIVAVIMASVGSLAVWGFFNHRTMAAIIARPLPELTAVERIKRAQIQLKELAKNPEQETQVLVSFNEFKPKELAKELQDQYGVKILQIFHGHIAPGRTYRGGFFVDENKPLTDEDLRNFEKQNKEDAQTMIKNIKQMLEREIEMLAKSPTQPVIEEIGEIDKTKHKPLGEKLPVKVTFIENVEGEKSVEGTRLTLADDEHRLAALEKYGLQIFGLEIKTTNDRIVAMSKHSAVGMIEVPNQSLRYERQAVPMLFGE